MAVKKCCIENCYSSTISKEDVGVTFHKFPKQPNIYNHWLSITKHTENILQVPSYVCSRHFRKYDFENYKGSKYILKSDAVPSIFPWNSNVKNTTISTITTEGSMDSSIKEAKHELPIKDEEMDIENNLNNEEIIVDAVKEGVKDVCNISQKSPNLNIETDSVDCAESNLLSVPAASFMDIILNDKAKDEKAKQSLSPSGKGNSMALSVGSRVEAKDYGELWYPASIVEVDYDEMEVLVHYDNHSKRHDEWINVGSPRLRPYTSSMKEDRAIDLANLGDAQAESKLTLKFEIGERCLARWKDNSRFAATIRKDLGNGKYEIVFDDGVPWTCSTSRLFKLKQDTMGVSSASPLHVDNPSLSPTVMSKSSSTLNNPIPMSPNITPNTKLPYHTHLFDPTRDYLGSKSERRELKRKLNIKALFNIGQTKRRHKSSDVNVDKAKKSDVGMKLKIKNKKSEIADTSTGTHEVSQDVQSNDKMEDADTKNTTNDIHVDDNAEIKPLNESVESLSTEEVSNSLELEELQLERFEQINEEKHEEVIGKIKKAIDKLEVGLETLNKNNEGMIQLTSLPEDEVKKEVEEVAKLNDTPIENQSNVTASVNVNENSMDVEHTKKTMKKSKRSKKLRLLTVKNVESQVKKAKIDLKQMKRQVAMLKKELRLRTEQSLLSKSGSLIVENSGTKKRRLNEDFLLSGEWCCKWVNGQPQGIVCEVDSEPKVDANNKPILPRCTVQVDDKRLPPLWTKHMVRRSLGSSAGKWDVLLVNPEKRKFHTKSDMKLYLETVKDDSLKPYEHALLDFGIHRKLSRRLGWDDEAKYDLQQARVPTLKIKKLRLNSGDKSVIQTTPKKKRKLSLIKSPREGVAQMDNVAVPGSSSTGLGAEKSCTDGSGTPVASPCDNSTLEDGFVYVGSLKVQIIENLLRCPAEGCYKNFRNNTLLKMHIKHYHRELRKMMGATPKVLDLAYARAVPMETDNLKHKAEHEPKPAKPKVHKQKRTEVPPSHAEPKNESVDILQAEVPIAPITPTRMEYNKIPRSQDSPKLRKALIGNKPVKRPRVLLPVRRPEEEPQVSPKIESPKDEINEEVDIKITDDIENDFSSSQLSESLELFDYETAISSHTVIKLLGEKRKKEKKTKLPITQQAKLMTASEEDDWVSDVETRSSFPRSGTPDSKIMGDIIPQTSVPVLEGQKESQYITTETGEKIKIVHMKREEIINCHCGFREEDGLMIQCELCLCWQHALCHNIQRESEVPEKYTCSICLNPRRGRRSRRFLHDQDRLYEGLLPGARPSEALRRSHELSGNLLRVDDALHALRVKYYVATKKDHPKLYLWAKDWESGEMNRKFNADYVDLNAMMSDIDKENLPLKSEDLKDVCLTELRTPPSEDLDELRLSQKSDGSGMGSQVLLANLLSSPGAGSLDLPISACELERLAKSVQESELSGRACVVTGPQPEAAIENSACRERLLKHIQRCQALIDSRLDSIEAQVAELESQDPSFEDDETADYFPRTKQTIQMLLRDLDTMEELGVIT